MDHLNNRHLLVLGLGESGLAMVRWCASHGAHVRVWDSREAPPQAATLRAELPQVQLTTGPLEAATALQGVELVLKSPGLSPLDERIRPLLEEARAAGIPVQGELDLFARALAELKQSRGYAPQVLAITGTNGKTTTTALTALLVERCDKRVAVAGNIGPTMLDTLAAALAQEPEPEPADEAEAAPAVAAEATVEVDTPAATAEPAAADVATAEDDAPAAEAERDVQAEAAPLPDDAPLVLAPPPPAAPVFQVLPEVWVLELSSFQLDGVRGFEPSAAAILNLSQDHLDWHGDMRAYGQAKARIWGEQALLVVNRDDPAVEGLVPAPLPEVNAATGKPFKAAKGKQPRTVARKAVRFGLDAPREPGDFGLVTENGIAWLVRALEADPTEKRRKGEAPEIHLQRLMPADALRIRGRHNAANALAALALASAIGCPLAPMLHGLREYRGEPHRVEFVATVHGVEAFDDSKGTNVGATVAALLGLGADKAPGKLVAILGGDGKGQDFRPLAAPLARHGRAVALIGRDAQRIADALAEEAERSGLPLGELPLRHHDTLPQAVAWSFEQAQAGDAVLLSPACASLDMFRNYAHRAEVFVQAVQALAAEHGEHV
ncbi:Mur ligase family protein [Aquincola tertiaricarbonis]|uniref:UDP-N-acetylmuramoylalanine--D-glutamate ligase n=1 Tax=Aquincola tertiaricarbonis TaxID=391953 RepID=A0ABY4SCE5_AQUTE|nr:UDP-N-acetylmuramoyl-L-alanine--D-glutamate ligase [Aquincola tertiaricarbonis]URI09582.1 Mur ligase family protein [Aquincola tertiaricarbonis]